MEKVGFAPKGLEKANELTKKKETTGVKRQESEELQSPDYVVSVTSEKVDKKSTYSPDEIKSKARSLLATGLLSKNEETVLEDILMQDGDAENINLPEEE